MLKPAPSGSNKGRPGTEYKSIWAGDIDIQDTGRGIIVGATDCDSACGELSYAEAQKMANDMIYIIVANTGGDLPIS